MVWKKCVVVFEKIVFYRAINLKLGLNILKRKYILFFQSYTYERVKRCMKFCVGHFKSELIWNIVGTLFEGNNEVSTFSYIKAIPNIEWSVDWSLWWNQIIWVCVHKIWCECSSKRIKKHECTIKSKSSLTLWT